MPKHILNDDYRDVMQRLELVIQALKRSGVDDVYTLQLVLQVQGLLLGAE